MRVEQRSRWEIALDLYFDVGLANALASTRPLGWRALERLGVQRFGGSDSLIRTRGFLIRNHRRQRRALYCQEAVLFITCASSSL